jgi:colanic acid/amylovoran biosynthesis glycosyltransferase
VRVAYLISRYPIVSHTFVLREVRALRALGLEVDTVTVVRVDRDELVEEETRLEDARTLALRPVGIGTLLGAHLWALARRPRRYVATLRRALAPRPSGLKALVWQLAYFAQAILLARHLHRRGIHHVHAHHANVASDVALLAAAYDPRGSWSFTMHGPTEFWDVGHFRLGEKTAAADFVACISDFARSQLMAQVAEPHWSKLHVVHCGVDPGAFAPREPVPAGPLRVLSVGRLAPQKGQGVLLQAIATLRDQGVDARLTLVGEGPSRPELERLVQSLRLEDRVVLTGAVGQDRIRPLYAEADVFCLTSFGEGVPIVLMEAMAMEIPVVAPAIMGIPELVEDGVSGLLTPPARPDATAAALASLARDPQRARALGRAGREAVVAGFDERATAARLRELFTAHA